MRNLKKILALVLALMMVLSTMVTASALDFNDAAEIDGKYAEAVQVMASLGVLKGIEQEDGSFKFDPKGTLTRAQAAVIISKVLEGSLENIELIVDAIDNPFTDVPDWALPYVLCAYSHGVMIGDGNGKFSPNRKLTGYEFGKMLLVAAGIKESADFTADSWKITVATGLSEARLSTGMNLTLSADLTREAACELAWRAMNYGETVYTIEFAAVDTISVALCEGQEFVSKIDALNYARTVDNTATLVNAAPTTGQFRINEVKKGTLAGEVFGLKTATGILTNNADITNGLKYSTIGGVNYAVATSYEELGHMFKVYYKDGAYDASKGHVVYSVADLSSEVVVATAITAGTGSTAKVAALFGTVTAVDGTNHSKIDNAGALTDAAITEVTFGAAANDGAVAAGTYITYGTKVIGYKVALAKDVVKVNVKLTDADKGQYIVGIDSDDDLFVKNSAVAADNYNYVVNADINWLDLFADYTEAEFVDGADESALYVVAQCGNNYHFSEVESFVGKVTKFGDKLYIDGQPYNTAADNIGDGVLAAETIIDFTYGTGATKLDFGKDYTFYLNETGAIFAALKVTSGSGTTTPEAPEYTPVYVVGYKEITGETDPLYGTTSYTYAIQYYTIDGAINLATNLVNYNGKKIIHTGSVGTDKVLYSDVTATGWMLLNESDKGLSVKAVDTASGYTTDTYTVSGTETLSAGSIKLGANLITNESIFMYSTATINGTLQSGAQKATVKTAAHNSTLADTTVINVLLKANASNESMNNIVAAYVPAAHAGVGSNDTTNVLYVLSYDGQIGKDQYVYSVMDLAGNVSTVTVKTNTGASLIGTFQTTGTDASGKDVLNAVVDSSAYTKAFNNPVAANYFVLNGVEYYGADIVTAAKVVDLRVAVLTGTEDAITSVKDMLDETLTATAIFDGTSGTDVISMIIITG